MTCDLHLTPPLRIDSKWETVQLGTLTVPRVFTGLWQLSSNAWGTAPSAKIRREMARHVDAGYTAFGTSPTLLPGMAADAPFMGVACRHGKLRPQPAPA